MYLVVVNPDCLCLVHTLVLTSSPSVFLSVDVCVCVCVSVDVRLSVVCLSVDVFLSVCRSMSPSVGSCAARLQREEDAAVRECLQGLSLGASPRTPA